MIHSSEKSISKTNVDNFYNLALTSITSIKKNLRKHYLFLRLCPTDYTYADFV